MKKLLSALLLSLLVSPSAYSADASMGPNNLRIDVQVEQTQGTSSRMRSSAGDFSKTDTNRRNLLVRLRRIGSCDPEVNVYAFFVAKATSGRISGFYGAGMQSANVKPTFARSCCQTLLRRAFSGHWIGPRHWEERNFVATSR